MIYSRPSSIEISSDDYSNGHQDATGSKRGFYNIGAGSWRHEFWTNIDLPPQTEAFAQIQAPCIYHDLIKQPDLPIETASVEAFYCSHVIEHLPEAVVLNLLTEAYRCLGSGGILRLVTGPCADLDWNALMREDKDWWYWFKDMNLVVKSPDRMGTMSIYDQWLYSVATPRSPWSDSDCDRKFESDDVKSLVRDYAANPYQLLDVLTAGLKFDYAAVGNHITWWNLRKLQGFLGRAGFSKVYSSAYGQSVSKFMRDLRYFDQTYPQISVYVEAVR